MSLKKRKYFTLDYLKWKCGHGSSCKHSKHGKGQTLLENCFGFQCCLGQFYCQLGAKDIDGISTPVAYGKIDGSKYQNPFISEISEENTDLSNDCIKINDDLLTTIATKVNLLKERLKQDGFILRLKNFPQYILKDIK